jgi:hypothetical protein
MSNPTSNFNWQMPTNTDLVSQLPADFEVFGQAVDTSLADLKGGTTGQVLKKNTNADMDFVWATDASGMTNPMTTTGDTIYSSSGSTPARLGIGSTGQVLTVSGGIPAWTTPAAGGKVLQVVQATTATETTISTTTYTDTGLSATITPTSATSKILVLTSQASRASGSGIEETGLVMRLMRGATAIFNNDNSNMNLRLQINNITATMGISAYLNYNYLDSPATTSATTYKTQAGARTNSMTAIFQTGSTQTSTMILMEIGA